jgi:TetR/AcrR family transcriptional repressor of nem operon
VSRFDIIVDRSYTVGAMGRTSDARDRLIESGQGLMHERGFTAVGVSEVCAHAGVNKGSFYHFFPSKQELALAVIARYAEEADRMFEEMLDGDGPPLERLKVFFDRNYLHHKAMRDESGQCLGCPLGNLALEMSPQDPVLRERLRRVFEGYAGVYARGSRHVGQAERRPRAVARPGGRGPPAARRRENLTIKKLF